MVFTRLADLDDLLWSGEMAARLVHGIRVLFVKFDDQICAYEDRCAHLGVPLSRGCLEGEVLTCSAHHWQYDARSGRGINPRSAFLRRFAVKVEGSDILVDVGRAAA